MKYEVTEICPHCDRENTLVWDPDKDGYEIYCPNCGEKMMLCTACYDEQRERGKKPFCDWMREEGCYRKRKGRITIEKKPVEFNITLDEMIQIYINENFSANVWDMFSTMHSIGLIDSDIWSAFLDSCATWYYFSDDGTQILDEDFKVVCKINDDGNLVKVKSEN